MYGQKLEKNPFKSKTHIFHFLNILVQCILVNMEYILWTTQNSYSTCLLNDKAFMQ